MVMCDYGFFNCSVFCTDVDFGGRLVNKSFFVKITGGFRGEIVVL